MIQCVTVSISVHHCGVGNEPLPVLALHASYGQYKNGFRGPGCVCTQVANGYIFTGGGEGGCLATQHTLILTGIIRLTSVQPLTGSVTEQTYFCIGADIRAFRV